MSISKMDFLDRVKLNRETLDVWIEEEWLIPRGTPTEQIFSEADLARAKLIQELIQDLGVNAEGVSVVLHLLDQMHGLRNILADLLQSHHERSIPPPIGLSTDKTHDG